MPPEAPSAAAPTLDAVVVVVTYDSAATLPHLLDSLPAAMTGVGNWAVVVADNGSTDDTVTVAQAHDTAPTVVRTGGNVGYAAAINVALDIVPAARAVLVCNPDVVLAPGTGGRLVSALGGRVGIAVPRLTTPAGTLQPSLRRDPTVLRALGEALLGGTRAGRFGPLGELVLAPDAYRRAHDVDWATGAVWCLSRECLRAVGPWDESFFLYSEEVDYAQRARDLGFAIRYEPDAVATHVGGDAPTSPSLWGLLAHNRARAFSARHGRVAAAAFRAALVLGAALRAARGSARDRGALDALRHGPRLPVDAAVRGGPVVVTTPVRTSREVSA